jgi:hypothetical protein
MFNLERENAMRSNDEQNHGQADRRRTRRNASLSVECLEGRALLSGLHGVTAIPAHAPVPNPAPVTAVSVHPSVARHALFVGIVRGTIVPSPDIQYAWAVDRNGRLQGGLIPERPGIKFDAQVVVTWSEGAYFQGPHHPLQAMAYVNTPDGATYLDAKAVRVRGNEVLVEVPAKLLPPTNPLMTLDLYGYDFITSLRGFTPEDFFPAIKDARVVMHKFKG